MNKPTDFKAWAVFALGLFFVLFGLPMVIGGSWLVILGGSWYYLPAGIAFIVSGWLLLIRRRLGATIYAAPTTESHWVQYPGYNGGSDWGGVSVDPQHGIIIANYNDMPNYNRLVPREEANRLGWFPRDDPRKPKSNPKNEGASQIGVPYAVDVNAGWRMPYTGLLCKQPPWGGIRAIDLASGKTLWDRPFGSARANGPFGIPSMLPVEIGTPNNGGSVITAGGSGSQNITSFLSREKGYAFRAILGLA